MKKDFFTIDLRSSLLTLGSAHTGMALLSLNRSLRYSLFVSVALLLFSVGVWAQQPSSYSVMPSTTNRMVNGTVQTPDQSVTVGSIVKVYCVPEAGFGMSRGVYYATRNANGGLSAPILAENKSTYPDDRANKSQLFQFTMPAADVEVWAYFVPLRELQIHQNKDAKCKLMPTYGLAEEKTNYAVAKNVPTMPIVLKPEIHKDLKNTHELVDVEVTNLSSSFIERCADSIIIYMPNAEDVVHVTPVFGKKNYNIEIHGDTTQVKVTLGNATPKAREEVDVILTAEKGYIPANITFEGCKSWWLAETPKRMEDGRWKTVYRMKVDLKDVSITIGHERVYNVTINDTKNTHRVQAYMPEMIPGYPGVARTNQQIPVVFMMPESFSVQYNTTGNPKDLLVYHNALKNSFADQGMDGWDDTTENNGQRLPIKVFTDSSGNNYWRTSGVNSMSQTVDLTQMSFPASAKQNNRLNIAAIASVNPCRAQMAKVSIVASGNDVSETLVVADPEGKEKDWITEFKVGTIAAKASELKLLVEAKADDENKRSYIGPMFDDLCLLLPTQGDTIKSEDVLIFKMDKSDVTINYTPSGELGTVTLAQKAHANVTLFNTVTGEQGDTIKAMKDDIILIKGQGDEGYAVYEMSCTAPSSGDSEGSTEEGGDEEEEEEEDEDDGLFDIGGSEEYLEPDSIDMATSSTYFRYVKKDNDDVVISPVVDKQKVLLVNYYGGKIEVDKVYAKKGERVVVTVTPKAGSRLKQIRTIPANAVQFTEEQVDQATGAGTYSFVMPTAFLTLKGEFIVPVTTAAQLDSISKHYGTFRLDNDLDLGNQWDKKQIVLQGDFDGNGHRITYGGNTSLFHTVKPNASVRHLYVTANVKGSKTGDESENYMGAICVLNNGIIEDCEISGSVKNEKVLSSASGVAGQNSANKEGGTIAYCHVLCDGLDARTIYGVANQEKGGVIKDNVFSGMFVNGDSRAYMICNDMDSVTIERNYYVPNAGNSRAVLCNGVTATTPAALAETLKNVPETNYVFTASIKNKYVGGYNIQFSLPANTSMVSISNETANAGTVVTASVSVSGNNHLESITISAPDGSDAFQCPFTDNTENVYTFSFTMPGHDVLITPQTKEGRFIYTASQFASINDQEGIFYLARDIDLNNWGKSIDLKGTFYGCGHTIRFHQEGSTKGLFNTIRLGALLEGLRVAGVVTSTENCGGIANENKGTIRNCHFCGEITRIAEKKSKKNRIAALVYKNEGAGSLVDHCSATGILSIVSKANQEVQVLDNSPLYVYSDASKLKSCQWISNAPTADVCQDLRTKANAASQDYPVYAQGILDRIDARVVTGNNSQTVSNGQSLAELTITDGEPFVCTSDVKVNQIIYKRKATKNLEPWVLPFAFNQMAGDGTFLYHEVIEKDSKPDVSPAITLTLSGTPQSVNYQFNKPWMVSNDNDGEERTYVLSNSDGSPITIKATSDHRVARYASILDIGSFFATYDTIPAKIVNDELLYVWNGTQQEFVLSNGSSPLQPNRFYLQFYSTASKKYVRYAETQWAKNENATPATSAAPRRLADVMADGWQPIFLDPRQPQSITASMLDYYDVAYLTDIRGEVLGEDGDSPLSAVSLIYMMADSRMDLPSALPLLVRAKRSDAEPLVDAQTGAELEELLMKMMEEDESDEESDEDDKPDLDMPHYWCASFDNRLDIWHLPAPERYADLAEYGCMMFNDNYYDQSFSYATANDTRTTAPMSYCLTLLNAKTYELLPLLGDRVSIEFLIPAGAPTGIDTVKGEGFMVHDSKSYNLNGQRVDENYKGITVQKGRKIYKR